MIELPRQQPETSNTMYAAVFNERDVMSKRHTARGSRRFSNVARDMSRVKSHRHVARIPFMLSAWHHTLHASRRIARGRASNAAPSVKCTHVACPRCCTQRRQISSQPMRNQRRFKLWSTWRTRKTKTILARRLCRTSQFRSPRRSVRHVQGCLSLFSCT